MTIYKFDQSQTLQLRSSQLRDICNANEQLEDALGEISAADITIVGDYTIEGLLADILQLARDITLLSYSYDEVACMTDDIVIRKAFGEYTINEVDDL